MLSIAVCDDEITECLDLSVKIKKILDGRNVECIIKRFQNGEKLVKSADGFDIIFLDIIMRAPNGMETARLLREKSFDKALVFVSSSREYVFDAYDVEAFNYLLKPIDDKKLESVLGKAISKIDDKSERFIIINKDRRQKKLFLDDIYYFEIWGRVIRVHGKNGAFDYYGKIGELEQKLGGDGFFRCHKSYLINLKYVNSYSAREIILDNGKAVPLSKRRYDGFCVAYLKEMRKMGGLV